jgi:hypothetical protein
MSDFGVYNENACLKSKKQGSGSFSRENTKGKTQISDFIKKMIETLKFIKLLSNFNEIPSKNIINGRHALK